MSLSGVVAEYGGWPLVFYIFGACTVVWFIPWLLLAYNSPHDHPRISPEEKMYIISELDAPHNKVLVFLISSFCHVLYVVCFLLGNSPASGVYMLMFRNTLSVPSSSAGRCE